MIIVEKKHLYNYFLIFLKKNVFKALLLQVFLIFALNKQLNCLIINKKHILNV